jgi:putative addiction module killer protein
VFEIIKSDLFDRWFSGLRDRQAAFRILARLDRVALGNLGDTKSVGDGIFELRIDFGPGYRIYFLRSGQKVIVLLCGGDKSTQDRDIVTAKDIAKNWKG